MPRACHTAIRTCVSCRRRSAAPDLLRLTLDARAVLQLDPTGHAPGRGAWVCPKRGCLARLQDKPGMAGRSLRRSPRGAGELLEAARALVDHQAIAALQHSHRSGLVRTRAGQRDAAQRSQTLVVLRPAGAEARTDGPGPTELPTPWTAQALGAALGRGPRSRLLLLKGAPNRRLLRKLRLRSALG